MSALPRQVQSQIDAANAIIDQMSGKSKDEEKSSDDANKQAAEKEQPKASTEQPKEQAPQPTETDAEHKYKVLQGKYNKEVPRLQQQLRQSFEENDTLRQRLNDMEATVASLKAVKEKPPMPAVSDEEREQFGDDLIDLISRVSKRDLLPEIEKRLKDVDGRVKQVGQKVASTEETMAESKRRETLKALADAVPNWEQQNEDPKFLEWLGEVEPSVGVERGRLLTDAFQSNDAHRVIWFFKGFQNENAADTAKATPSQEKKESQPKLDDYVAPGSPKTGTASAPNESGKRVWTRNDIKAFYAEKNEYVKKGKKLPDEMLKLERDLFKAQHEGRLR